MIARLFLIFRDKFLILCIIFLETRDFMQFFENEIVQKKYRNIEFLKHVGMTLLFITIILSLGYYLFKKTDVGKPMNDYLFSDKLETEKKASIDVIQEPLYIGNYSKEDKIYFLVKDQNYSYVTKISEENYHKYQNASLENPIKMSGTTKEISEPLMMAIINALNKDAKEEDYVNASWFVNYLGLLYLDEGEEPQTIPIGVIFLVFLGAFSIFLIVLSFLKKFHYEKNIAYMSLEEIKKLDKELNENALYYPSLQVSITKHSLINLKGVFSFYPLDKIILMYPFEIKEGEQVKKRGLKIITNDFEEHKIAISDVEEEEFSKFYKELGKKNKQILKGYTKENQQKLQKMKKNANTNN